ncbi:MAG TPA: hypothetical protein PLF75_01485, partial [Bacteroidales bacterium]|nr:hypothetical protein [Bacteroidales bacterium]
MPERKWILLSIILLYLAILPACEKLDNYNRISYDYPYHANFAFAIGSSVLNLPKLGRNLPMGWEEHPELLVIPDSIILEDHLPFEPQSWIEQGSTKIAQIVIKIRGYNEFPDWAQLTFMLTDSLNHS